MATLEPTRRDHDASVAEADRVRALHPTNIRCRFCGKSQAGGFAMFRVSMPGGGGAWSGFYTCGEHVGAPRRWHPEVETFIREVKHRFELGSDKP